VFGLVIIKVDRYTVTVTITISMHKKYFQLNIKAIVDSDNYYDVSRYS